MSPNPTQYKITKIRGKLKAKLEAAIFYILRQNEDDSYLQSLRGAAPFAYAEKVSIEKIINDLCGANDRVVEIRGYSTGAFKRFLRKATRKKVSAYYDPKYPNVIFWNKRWKRRSIAKLNGTLRHEDSHTLGYSHKHNSPHTAPSKYKASVPVTSGRLSQEWVLNLPSYKKGKNDKPKNPKGGNSDDSDQKPGGGNSHSNARKGPWWAWRNWRILVRIAKLLVALVKEGGKLRGRRKATLEGSFNGAPRVTRTFTHRLLSNEYHLDRTSDGL